MAVTGEAKWIATTDTINVNYDSDGKYKSTDTTKKVIGVFDKASVCVQFLQKDFNETQKFFADGTAKFKNTWWYKAEFPMIEHKAFFINSILFGHFKIFYSCEEEK